MRKIDKVWSEKLQKRLDIIHQKIDEIQVEMAILKIDFQKMRENAEEFERFRKSFKPIPSWDEALTVFREIN